MAISGCQFSKARDPNLFAPEGLFSLMAQDDPRKLRTANGERWCLILESEGGRLTRIRNA